MLLKTFSVLTLSFFIIVQNVFALEGFEYSKSIESSKNGYSYFVIDEEILKNTKKNFADIRILSESQQEVPYITKYSTQEPLNWYQSNSVSTKLINTSYSESNSQTEIEITNNEVYSHNILKVFTDTQNFRANVKLESYTDNEWRLIKEDVIYHYIFERIEDNVRFEKSDFIIHYPENTSAKLKLTITPENETVININSISVSGIQKVENLSLPQEDTPVDIISSSLQEGNVSSIILSSPELYKTKLAFDLPNERFYRNTQLYSSNDKKTWKKIASEIIFKGNNEYTFNNEIYFPENKDKYLKLEIGNKNDQPIDVSNFRVTTKNYHVIFPSIADEKYTVFFSNPRAYTPEYDLKRYITQTEIESAKQVFLLNSTKYPNEIEKTIAPEEEPAPIIKYLLLGLGSLILIIFVMNFMRKN